VDSFFDLSIRFGVDTVFFNTEIAEDAEKKKSFAEPAVEDGLVGVDAAVA
jgi:hypothetical protein